MMDERDITRLNLLLSSTASRHVTKIIGENGDIEDEQRDEIKRKVKEAYLERISSIPW